MQVEVTDADRELFITLSNADGQMAERILCGAAFTWEVEQIARHRIAERERVVGEIVAWLWANNDYADDDEREYKEFLVNQIAAKFGGRDVAG